VYSSIPNLDSDKGIQGTDSGLEWSKIWVFIRKHSKVTSFHPEAYTDRDIFF
jgi:hypothetical protein